MKFKIKKIRKIIKTNIQGKVIDEKYHAWTVNDARVGEVLISEWGQPFIYSGKCHNPISEKIDNNALCAYCGINQEGFKAKLIRVLQCGPLRQMFALQLLKKEKHST